METEWVAVEDEANSSNPTTQAEWNGMVAQSTQWDDMTAEEREQWMPTVAHPWSPSGREQQGRAFWERVCARPVVQ